MLINMVILNENMSHNLCYINNYTTNGYSDHSVPLSLTS